MGRNLIARRGHSSTRVAIIYQHAIKERDKVIADALGQLVSNAPRLHLACRWPNGRPTGLESVRKSLVSRV
jgi:hypothetical protein